MHSNGAIFHCYALTYVYLQHDPKSFSIKMFPKCSKTLIYNAMFNVKVANGQA